MKPVSVERNETLDETFRAITWNCRRAGARSALWDYFMELDPDVALLQEERSSLRIGTPRLSDGAGMKEAGTLTYILSRKRRV
jgi:hypothetical protein